jgi:hypothetical protein
VFHGHRPTQVIIIIIMGKKPCAKCGGRKSGGKPGHLAATCQSSTELREKCLCNTVEGLDYCGERISDELWKKGYRINKDCEHFKAEASSLMALIGTCIPGRKATIKAPKRQYSGTGAVRDRLRDEAEARGESRRRAEGGGAGGRGGGQNAAPTDGMEQDHVDRLKAASKTERDEHGCLAVANEFWDIVDDKSPIVPRLCIQLPDPSAKIMRERNGDPTLRRKDEPSPETVTPDTMRCIISLIFWMKMARDKVFMQCWDVELQRSGDNFKAVEEKDGLGAAYASTCWESALSEALCSPNAPISRRDYACVDTSKNETKAFYKAAEKKTVTVVISGPTLSNQEQQAVLQSRDPRYPITIQKGPERPLAPWLLCIAVAIWDMVDAMNRACGHENGGKNNERITMPVNTDFLGWVFDRKFEHRAEPDTRDEIYFAQELGLALYWKLKNDPNSRIDQIIDERFPGTDPTKWDFSSLLRSAAASQTSGASRKRKPSDSDDE